MQCMGTIKTPPKLSRVGSRVLKSNLVLKFMNYSVPTKFFGNELIKKKELSTRTNAGSSTSNLLLCVNDR